MKVRQLMRAVLACIGAVLPAATWAAPDAPAVLQNVPAVLQNARAVLGASGQPPVSHYNFGSQSALVAQPVVHDFTLYNGSTAPLTVTRLQASCGCTTAVLTSQAAAGQAAGTSALPLVLAPRETASVHISVAADHLLPGTINKDVWVYVKGQEAPAATLEIDGTVVPVAAFVPAALDFSRTSAEKAPVLTLTVTLDPHAFAAMGLPSHPVLTSSSPDISVSEAAPSKTFSASEVYQVRLTPKAKLGVLNERLLLFASEADRQAGKPVPGASVPVLGEVTGEIGASPEAIVFGTVSAERSGVQRVTLTAANPQVLRRLTLYSASPSITVRLLDAAGQPWTAQSSSASAVTLEVTVTPKGPGYPALSGSLQTQVLVTTASGQQLILPVFVSVAS